jgi:hypothetical protein
VRQRSFPVTFADRCFCQGPEHDGRASPLVRRNAPPNQCQEKRKYFVTFAGGRFCKEYEQPDRHPNRPAKVMIKPEEIEAIERLLDELETPDAPLLQTDAPTGPLGVAPRENQPGQSLPSTPSPIGIRPPAAWISKSNAASLAGSFVD